MRAAVKDRAGIFSEAESVPPSSWCEMADRSVVLGDGLVVCDDDQVLVLNNTARLIWEALSGGLTTRQVVNRLCADYGVEYRRAVTDVQALQRLCRRSDPAVVARAMHRIVPWSAAADGGGTTSSASGGWQTHTYMISGIPVRVRCNGRQIWDLVHRPFAHLESAVGAGVRVDVVVGQEGDEVVARVNRSVLVSHPDPRVVLMHLFYELSRMAAFDRDWLVVMHAAAVSRGDHCVVLPAPGGSGKSTLTAALLYSGFTYLGDDLVPLDRQSRMAIPVPMSLKIKHGSVQALQKFDPGLPELEVYHATGMPETRYLTPPGFEQGPPKGAYAVRSLVFPSYRPGVETRVEAVAPLTSLEYILASGAVVRQPVEHSAVAELVEWIEGVPAFELTYSDLDEAVEVIEDITTEPEYAKGQGSAHATMQ